MIDGKYSFIEDLYKLFLGQGFPKEIRDDYEFIGCFRQEADNKRLKELFEKGIKNQRQYKKISSRVDLSKFNKN